MDEELLQRLRSLMGRVPADATRTPPMPTQPTIGPPTGTRVPASPRGVLAVLQRSAQPSPDTPAGWVNEAFNPIRAGAQAREFMGSAGRALRRGDVGGAIGAGALAAMNVPGSPARVVRQGVDAAEMARQAAAMRNLPVSIEPRPYFNVPDKLLGYGRTPKGFNESNFPYTQTVLVRWPGQEPHIDQIRGLNQQHALERARRNWEGADIRPYAGPLEP